MQSQMNWLKIILVALLGLGCSTSSKVNSSDESDSVELAEAQLNPEAAEDLTRMIESAEKSVDSPDGKGLDLTLNQQAQKWIDHFTGPGKARFQRYLNRGSRYREVVETILVENNLPRELYFLPMIESGFVTTARSNKRAVGIWQFVPGTGRAYGLKYDYYLDERRDPIRATEAAAGYLRDLYNVFQSWHLALAAYNAGEYRVLGAIIRGKSRDFWELSRKKKLPKETRNYVPKFVAAAVIGKNPTKFGFESEEVDPYPSVEAVELPSPVDFASLGKTVGMSKKQLLRLNPQILRGMTPPRLNTYEVWIPKDKVALVQAKIDDLKKIRASTLTRTQASPNFAKQHHKVRKGESLYEIARQYRVSVSYLRSINGIQGNRIYPNQNIRISAGEFNQGKTSYHLVARGDTLESIASRYGLTIKALKGFNGLKNDRIYPGQKLRLKLDDAHLKVKHRYHRVKKGENLQVLAKKYGVEVNRIKLMNQMTSSRIYAGQRIRVQ